MKVTYLLAKLVSKEVHGPSTDYYARSGDSDTSTITVLESYGYFDTHDDAIQKLIELQEEMKLTGVRKYYEGEYVITPTYTI